MPSITSPSHENVQCVKIGGGGGVIAHNTRRYDIRVICGYRSGPFYPINFLALPSPQHKQRSFLAFQGSSYPISYKEHIVRQGNAVSERLMNMACRTNTCAHPRSRVLAEKLPRVIVVLVVFLSKVRRAVTVLFLDFPGE